MAKYSTPGIKITEIDNTIRSNSQPGLGVGAIVFKSNKGPVNQRVLATNYGNFTRIFGEPENLDDYGHFAAENYLSVSNQLLCVRATMGDEGYAQIQYPYTNASTEDTYLTKDLTEFKYVDNERNANLKILEPLPTSIPESVVDDKSYNLLNGDLSGFAVTQKAQFGIVRDVTTVNTNTSSLAIFKYTGENTGSYLTDPSCIDEEGMNYIYPTQMSDNGNTVKKGNVLLTNDSLTSGTIPASSITVNQTAVVSSTKGDPEETNNGYRITFNVPKDSLLSVATNDLTVTTIVNEEFKNTILSARDAGDTLSYSDIFKDENFYKINTSAETPTLSATPAARIKFLDFDDLLQKQYCVNKEEFSESVGQVVGIQYREYGFNTLQENLAAVWDPTHIVEVDTIPSMLSKNPEIIKKLATDEYFIDDINEINDKKYSYIKYYDVLNGKPTEDSEDNYIEKIIYTKEWNEFKNKLIKLDEDTIDKNGNEYLFWNFKEKDKKQTTTISTYVQEQPNFVVIPWQEGLAIKNDESSEPIDKIIAFSSSEIFNSSSDETYKDGYTISMESDDEPGIGDVEKYNSNKNNQLIITALGPGEYGNDVGISIITTECEKIPSLNHQNAFNWKYRYDDEDQVDDEKSDKELTWKKVYRINVYVKNKTQTAEAAWGNGMDALLKDPTETWYVSNDPTAKDAEGNSLYVPNVINGHSEYIYVSRNSVNNAKMSIGTYAQPRQTYSIYGLTGGSNSKKNNVTEKTAALKLYKDRQKAEFDILFNVEAVDTFNGRQRFAAHQRKIAEIAANRTVDIGVVQVTSKESKTIKRQISDAKMFTFNNGTYVAEYAGYDKYYNYTLASWIYLPKSVAAACAMAYCDMYSYPWMAPAGVARGTIGYSSNQLSRLTDDEIGQLYDTNVNTSRLCGGFGEVLWGQKTALKKESALNRVNVRRCLNFIEKQLELMMLPYLFQQNTANTRSAAKNSIDAFLSRVKAAEGLDAYAVSVTQDPEDEHIMLVNLRVIPAECIEFVDIKITVDRNSGVSAVEM